MQRRCVVIALIFISSCLVSLNIQGQSNSPCDRACLEGFVDKYLDALIAQSKRGRSARSKPFCIAPLTE